MSDELERYTKNQPQWLFDYPTVGSSWNHSIEKECYGNKDREEAEAETDSYDQQILMKKLIFFGIVSTISLLGMAISIEMPRITEANLNVTENLYHFSKVIGDLLDGQKSKVKNGETPRRA